MARKATATDESHFLKALIKKEEALLADERKALQEMEKNAKNAKAQKEKQANSVCGTSCYRSWAATNLHLRRSIEYCDNWMIWPPAKTSNQLGLPFLGMLASEQHSLMYVGPLGQIKDANRYFTVGRRP